LSAVPQHGPECPNIIVCMVDDMGFSGPGCFGGEIRTPNLDRLAAVGVRFVNFHNAARCCPSQASILIGLYPHQTGVGFQTSEHWFAQGATSYFYRLSREGQPKIERKPKPAADTGPSHRKVPPTPAV
jgi:arylsulfatase A-like enzyme